MLELNLKASEIMDNKYIETGNHEHRLARIPRTLRTMLNLQLDNFVHLKSKNGNMVTLQVSEVYDKDDRDDQFCGYVTSNNYNRINITQHDECHKSTKSAELHRVEGITLGCDPEAFLVHKESNNVMAAYRFFGKYGEVGHDGILIEFRPMHSCDAGVVTDNIHRLLLRARTVLDGSVDGKDIKIVGASALKGLTAGFHLHYGLPKDLLGQNTGVKRAVANIITKALDYYTGVPSIIPEGNDDVLRRTVPYVEYGKPGGYRLSFRTFEYRLPGGICMVHPILTMGLLSLGAVVVEDLISRMKICTDNFTNFREITTESDLKALYPSLPNIETIYGLICCKRIEPARSHLNKIMNDVRQMIGYKHQNRSIAIENFFNCIQSGRKFDNNIEQNWRFAYNEK